MKEFMFLIRNAGDQKSAHAPGQHREFLEKCEVYISTLKKEGRLISAQPVERQGKIISGSNGKWKEEPFTIKKEMWVGYYHILADDLEEAVAIAKKNPEFEYGTMASIEVRPLKMMEVTTGFVYPSMPRN
ncbi:MAG: YciI family protein [Bacteroidetes bacterium]|nr:YciI family protein [Bacteroidota bacterium]